MVFHFHTEKHWQRQDNEQTHGNDFFFFPENYYIIMYKFAEILEQNQTLLTNQGNLTRFAVHYMAKVENNVLIDAMFNRKEQGSGIAFSVVFHFIHSLKRTASREEAAFRWRCGSIYEETNLRFNLVQLVQLFIRQWPIENIKILLDSFWPQTARQHTSSSLQSPSQNDLKQ